MSFGRQEQVVLVRSREDIPWGFRFAHVQNPLFPEITRINPNGLASQQMRIGQLILEVNTISTRGLNAHTVANLIRQQGNRLTMILQSQGPSSTYAAPTDYQGFTMNTNREEDQIFQKTALTAQSAPRMQPFNASMSTHYSNKSNVNYSTMPRISSHPMQGGGQDYGTVYQPTTRAVQHQAHREEQPITRTNTTQVKNQPTKFQDGGGCKNAALYNAPHRSGPVIDEKIIPVIKPKVQQSRPMFQPKPSKSNYSKSSSVDTSSSIIDTGKPSSGRLMQLLQQEEEARKQHVIEHDNSNFVTPSQMGVKSANYSFYDDGQDQRVTTHFSSKPVAVPVAASIPRPVSEPVPYTGLETAALGENAEDPEYVRVSVRNRIKTLEISKHTVTPQAHAVSDYSPFPGVAKTMPKPANAYKKPKDSSKQYGAKARLHNDKAGSQQQYVKSPNLKVFKDEGIANIGVTDEHTDF